LHLAARKLQCDGGVEWDSQRRSGRFRLPLPFCKLPTTQSSSSLMIMRIYLRQAFGDGLSNDSRATLDQCAVTQMKISFYILIAGAFFAGPKFSAAAPADGPLRVSAENPRYFADPAGKVVYLTGLHTWANLQDQGPTDPPPKFDYARYLEDLRRYNHNFIRMWAWEQARWAP